MARRKLDTMRGPHGSDSKESGPDDEEASPRKKLYVKDLRESILEKTKPDNNDDCEIPQAPHTCSPANQLPDDFEQDDFLPLTLERVFETPDNLPLDDSENEMEECWETEILELI